ncbi:MAG: hypothetical protein PF444_07730 [Bacteroidales bacterium]|jgi:hypothetical protein|nr:hypothetical protein [Bacteroidales bacterium]
MIYLKDKAKSSPTCVSVFSPSESVSLLIYALESFFGDMLLPCWNKLSDYIFVFGPLENISLQVEMS